MHIIIEDLSKENKTTKKKIIFFVYLYKRGTLLCT